MDIIILGFVLIIVGVSLTLLYDRYKENKVVVDATIRSKIDATKSVISSFQSAPKRKAAPKKTKYDEVTANEDFLQKFTENLKKTTTTTVLKRQTPIKQKKILADTKAATVEELIAKIEEMKKEEIMQVIKSSRIIMFDVDDTLVLFPDEWRRINPEGVGLINIYNPDGNCTELVMPHERHIQLLKEFKVRGHTIVVWSQGGHAWAESVCKVLNIDHWVDIVMDKPSWYVDDLPAESFMRAPIYLDPLDPAKDKRWGTK